MKTQEINVGQQHNQAPFVRPEPEALSAFLVPFGRGKVISIHSIYPARTHLTCHFSCYSSPDSSSAQQHLQLVTMLSGEQQRLEFAIRLNHYLQQHNLPISPILGVQGQEKQYIGTLNNHPAIVFELPEHLGHLPEKHITCQQIGEFLGKMHHHSQHFTEKQINPRSLLWLQWATESLKPHLSIGDTALLQEQVNRLKKTSDASPNLPIGGLLGSCFQDQLIFKGNILQQVTGFYFCCSDWLLLDVAQAVNEWCCDTNGALDAELADQLLNAYQQYRPFTTTENQYWQDILCFSATRFWVSRLLTQYMTSENYRLPSTTKNIRQNPDEYRHKLQHRIYGFHPLPQ